MVTSPRATGSPNKDDTWRYIRWTYFLAINSSLSCLAKNERHYNCALYIVKHHTPSVPIFGLVTEFCKRNRKENAVQVIPWTLWRDLIILRKSVLPKLVGDFISNFYQKLKVWIWLIQHMKWHSVTRNNLYKTIRFYNIGTCTFRSSMHAGLN
jgi:hypothetical protein